MIVEFSLDEDFFSAQALNEDSFSAAHDFLTSSWMNAGVLVLPKGGVPELVNLIKKLPAKYQDRWREALEYGKKFEIDREWWRFSNFKSFEELCALRPMFSTAFSDEAVGLCLGTKDTYRRSCEVTGFELLAAGVSSESKHIADSAKISSEEISEEESPQQVWDARFAMLAKHSKKITVVDRYLFESMQRYATNRDVDPAIKNFFAYLTKTGRKHNVRIISHGDERNSGMHAAVSDIILRHVLKVPEKAAVLESLTLVSAKEDFFRRESHDRFFGFDAHLCQVGVGMRVFGETPLPRSAFFAKFDRQGDLARREALASSREFRSWQETF